MTMGVSPVPPPDDRPAAYLDVDRQVPIYRASGSGGCVRALCAARMGFEPVGKAEVLARAASAGQALESQVIGLLQSQGWMIDSRQQEFEIVLPALVIRGHVDGLARRLADGRAETYLLEIKTMGPTRWETYRRHGLTPEHFPDYCAQVACYAEHFRLPVLYAVVLRGDGADGPAVRDMDVRVYPQPPVPFEEVRRHLLSAELAARKGRLPDCDRRDQFFCPFRYLCQQPPQTAAGVLVDLQAKRLAEWARRYLAAREARDAAETAREQAAEELRGLLERAGVQKAAAHGYTAQVVTSTRRGLDLRRLEADFGPRLDPYRTETVTTSVRVSGPGAKGGD
jgi:hypothetical protein